MDLTYHELFFKTEIIDEIKKNLKIEVTREWKTKSMDLYHETRLPVLKVMLKYGDEILSETKLEEQ